MTVEISWTMVKHDLSFFHFASQVLQRHGPTTGQSVSRCGHCLCSLRGGCKATEQHLENRLKMDQGAELIETDWTIQTQLATSVKSKDLDLNRDLWPRGFKPSICVCIVEAKSLSHEKEHVAYRVFIYAQKYWYMSKPFISLHFGKIMQVSFHHHAFIEVVVRQSTSVAWNVIAQPSTQKYPCNVLLF